MVGIDINFERMDRETREALLTSLNEFIAGTLKINRNRGEPTVQFRTDQGSYPRGAWEEIGKQYRAKGHTVSIEGVIFEISVLRA